ncbi:MAG TPA: iron ABC transporter permease [Candidatus Coprenecus stercoravium]|uniref:Iron ABC transporter permease n=1 Tax=Candidatus Coprenecus stercoravium TaxID=2840735 RepID=A0A9D2GNF7_9BACT|nr:iron ABC transporter permease [Candidatus Coprenecus stercoravium]
MSGRSRRIYYVLLPLLVCLAAGNMFYGAVPVPPSAVWNTITGGGNDNQVWGVILLGSRLPQMVTALLAGAALAVSGLLLQTLFRNPLAGPSILGISDGANLGVALVMLAFGGTVGSLGGYLATVAGAMLGACMILAVIVFFSRKVSSSVMLLIIGIMVGYLVSSCISILNYYASADKVRQFVMWGMGDFSAVSSAQLPFFAAVSCIGLLWTLLLVKPLNALLLGERYAANLGVNVRSTRINVLLCTGLMTAVVTAFCGPISFIGLAVPHIARLLTGTSDHRTLVPATMLSGACIALVCTMLTVIPGTGTMLPLNAVTPLFGAPVIIYVIVNRKNLQYFN